jgi:hypothetical protein
VAYLAEELDSVGVMPFYSDYLRVIDVESHELTVQAYGSWMWRPVSKDGSPTEHGRTSWLHHPKGFCMSLTRLAAMAFCLTLLAFCPEWSDSSRAEAPAPQDSLWSQQWNMKNTGQLGGTSGIDVGLLGAWDFTIGSDQVKVALIGAAAAYAHPDFIPASGSNRIIPAGGPIDYSVRDTSSTNAQSGASKTFDANLANFPFFTSRPEFG